MKVLSDRLALVTGAGRGLGAAIARGLAEAGAKVVVTDIDGASAEETASSIVADGFEAWGQKLDVTDRKALKAFAERAGHHYGSLSILVNNAGVAGNARIGDSDSEETWDRNIAVHMTGAFNTTRAFLPALTATRGSVINVSSVVAYTSGFAHVGYVAAKGGVKALTQAMCRELAPHSIRVNAVAPGYMDTAMGGKEDAATVAWLNWHCPLKRFGEPHEVAGPVVFLASPAASFINGVTLPIDGGYLVI